MIRTALSCLIIALGVEVVAETIVPVRTIRAHAIIAESDLTIRSGTVSGAIDHVSYAIGQEARTTLYAGRPIRFDDIGPPALVSRNQIVPLRFEGSGLVIMTEGRSLERGSLGDRVRVMNLDSRATLFGKVREDGSVQVIR
ncbi:flagellar basal body P-ring formation chaperone FlgA [Roseobacter ponti]|uniref:Flagella basal body P-ring formation protein FlgA n=1 Tax=Roseobacter ponti TaxID=1891787 RepID=A0A858SXI0_9RHOB|nr:flagellar basal body P-ring formation chaperone FlgA [Roseobacter ponti]QJF52980.1 flagellar basal body P-ring formation protein FlgA [Roseobacter ponti]